MNHSDEFESLEKELKLTRLAYQTLGQINQFKAGFLARSAHEIRSPLSSLMGLHQLILNDLCESPEEEREFIAQAYQSAQKLIKIIDEIILVSKLEYGRVALQKETVKLKDILDNLFTLLSLPAANKNLKFYLLEIDENIQVIADEQKLLLSLVNLLEAAIHWMEKGTISLTALTSETSQKGIISLLIDCPTSIWQESINSLNNLSDLSPNALKQFAPHLAMSAGEKYLLSYHLIEAMGGELTLIAGETNLSTQLQIAFPLPER